MKNFILCDRISVSILSLTGVLSLIAFVPGNGIPAGVFKGYLFIIGIILTFAFWLFGRLIEGVFRFPKSLFFLSIPIVILVFLISTFFSKSSVASFMGESFDGSSFIVITLLLVSLFLTSVLFRSRKRTLIFLSIFSITYIALALFQLMHIIFPAATALGVFTNKVATPVGTWNDFSLLSGFMLVAFTLLLEFLNPSRMMRIASFIGGILALFFVILTNVFLVWVFVGLFGLFVLVYKIISARQSDKKQFPVFAFVLALIALLFIPANDFIGAIVSERLGTSYVNVTPSLTATSSVALQSIKNHPIVGIGPNQFLHEWLMYRPAEVNNSIFWDFPFQFGHNYLLTIGFLSGILGLLAVLLFVILYFRDGLGKVFLNNNTQDTGNIRFIFSLFILSLYLFLTLLVSAPSISIIVCTFIFAGIFFGNLIATGRLKERTLSFLTDQRTSFFTILISVGTLLISASLLYAVSGRFVSIIYFNKAIRDVGVGDFSKADRRITQALSLSDIPAYYRARVGITQGALNDLLAKTDDNTSGEALKNSIQQLVSAGDAAARQAIQKDPNNIQNYFVLGDFMRLLATLKVDGSIAVAKDAYTRIVDIMPTYPRPELSLARLYSETGDNKTARTYIDKALEKKTNYTEAYFLLAQIEITDGNTANAVKKLEEASAIDPNNPDVHFELGAIRYQAGNYADAEFSFSRVVSIDNSYVNAWYYLALTKNKLGKTSEAIAILEKLHEAFPDNADIAKLLSSLRSGQPDSDSNTESAKTEQTTTKTSTAKTKTQ